MRSFCRAMAWATMRTLRGSSRPRRRRRCSKTSRAGKRLMGFTRTNLFKRLESSWQVFLQSLQRHILRNYLFLYAIENDKPLPIGQQDAVMLDSRVFDEDLDAAVFNVDLFDG